MTDPTAHSDPTPRSTIVADSVVDWLTAYVAEDPDALTGAVTQIHQHQCWLQAIYAADWSYRYLINNTDSHPGVQTILAELASTGISQMGMTPDDGAIDRLLRSGDDGTPLSDELLAMEPHATLSTYLIAAGALTAKMPARFLPVLRELLAERFPFDPALTPAGAGLRPDPDASFAPNADPARDLDADPGERPGNA